MTFATMLVVAIAAAPFVTPEQAIRAEALDPNATTHMVEVTGWLGMMTTVQFPDSFEVKNVRCGACVSVDAPDAPGGIEGFVDRRNWAIEVSPNERNIHLRPREMPTADNPIAAFSTNVFVTLDGGHSINLRLRLWDPRTDGAAAAGRHADAVVTLTLPQMQTLSGRLSHDRTELIASHKQDVAQASHQWLLERLSGPVRCQKQAWSRPHRVDKSVVRLKQLCLAQGKQHLAWAVVQIENDGDTPLVLQDIVLEPEDASFSADEDATTFWVAQPNLNFGASACGVASYMLPADAPPVARWRLRMVPASEDRQPVTINHLVF